MISIECTDFYDAFIKLNRLYIEHPEKVAFMDVDKGYMQDVIIQCDDPHISLDISTLGYKKSKWTNLVNKYICEEDLLAFKDKIDNTSTLTATFLFRNKKPDKDLCLMGLVLGRSRRKDPWDTLTINYRVCECERKMAIDLILINRILREYIKVNPKKIIIHLPYCYCEAGFINGVWGVLAPDINRDDIIPNTPFMKCLISSYQRWFKDDSRYSLYRTRRVLQELSRGQLDIGPVLSDDLSIKEVIKK